MEGQMNCSMDGQMVDGERERGTGRLLKQHIVGFCGAAVTLQSQPCPCVTCHSCTHVPCMENGTHSVIYKTSHFLFGKFHQAPETQDGLSMRVPHVNTCACLYGGEWAVLPGVCGTGRSV